MGQGVLRAKKKKEDRKPAVPKLKSCKLLVAYVSRIFMLQILIGIMLVSILGLKFLKNVGGNVENAPCVTSLIKPNGTS